MPEASSCSKNWQVFHYWTPCNVSSEPFLKQSIICLSSVLSLVFFGPRLLSWCVIFILDLSFLVLPSPWWGVAKCKSSPHHTQWPLKFIPGCFQSWSPCQDFFHLGKMFRYIEIGHNSLSGGALERNLREIKPRKHVASWSTTCIVALSKQTTMVFMTWSLSWK